MNPLNCVNGKSSRFFRLFTAENWKKMYLQYASVTAKFAREYDDLMILKKSLSVITILILSCSNVMAQQDTSVTIWPGDINNNGIVNNVDVLYWSIANGSTGPARAQGSPAWEGQIQELLWEDAFSNGLNFAYADANGDGVVDEGDLNGVIKRNFGRTHGQVISDFENAEDSQPGAIFRLQTNIDTFGFNSRFPVEVLLGAPDQEIEDFYGLAFTLQYNPDFVSKVNNSVQVDPSFNTWAGEGNPDSRTVVFTDSVRGLTQVAIVLTEGQSIQSGSGRIANLNIVMEDIVVGRAIQDMEMVADSIKVIGLESEERIAAPDSLNAVEKGNTVAVALFGDPSAIQTFPNPFDDQITIAFRGEKAERKVQRISVYNSTGQLMIRREINALQARMQMSLANLPAGMYFLRVDTSDGVYVKSITK